MNSLRRKNRSREASRPSLLSYQLSSSAGDYRQYDIDGCGTAMYQTQLIDNTQSYCIQNTNANTQYKLANSQYVVPLSNVTNQYNVPLGNGYHQNSIDLQYSVAVNTKSNQYRVPLTGRNISSQPYNKMHQNLSFTEQCSAKKSKYDGDYENKNQNYENVMSPRKYIMQPLVQPDNNSYYNTNYQNKTPYDRCDSVHITDNALDTPRLSYSDSRNSHEEMASNGSKEVTKRRLRTSLSNQPSFRQHQISNSNTTSTNSGAVKRTMEGVVKRRKQLVLLGLDGAGKTTILMRLKYKCYMATTPTVGFNHEKVWGGGFRWSAWDVGGGERVRPLWATYSRGTDCIVYVVDATANTDTMEEARLELTKIMKLTRITAHQMKKPPPPLLVMANFQDRGNARNAPEIAKCLSLENEGVGAVSSCWAVACVCGVTGDGLDEALATLRQMLDRGPQSVKPKSRHFDIWR